MFRKDKESGEKSRSLLKNKEIRNLRADIIKQFPSLDEEQLSLVIPNKSQVFQAKLLSKTIVYYVESTPVIFDLNGRNNFYPTLQLLWHFPNMIMSFTIHGPVSEFIMNGADLMSAGIFDLTGLESLKEGSKVSIKIKGNPLPFALGDSLVNYISLASPGKKRGKALSVVHLYGDRLSGSVPPNAGFGESVIYPTEDIPNYELEEESSDEEEETGKPSGNKKEHTVDDGETGGVDEDESGDDDKEGDGNEEEERDSGEETNDEDQVEDEEEVVDGKDDTAAVEAPMKVTSAQMDEWLERSLLLALKYVVKDHQLPMLASAFWTVLMRYIQSMYSLDCN
jgi:translation initiation factor 2D